MPSQATLTLRDALRDHCMPKHMRLEAVVEQGAYFGTLEGYRNWLAVMRGVHETFGAPYDAGCVALGLSPMTADLIAALDADLDGCPPALAPQVAGDMHPVGVAYVFEGSAMGGAILLRRLTALPDAPRGYLDHLVSTSRTRWPHTKRALSSMTDATQPILNGAEATFDMMISTFQAALR